MGILRNPNLYSLGTEMLESVWPAMIGVVDVLMKDTRQVRCRYLLEFAHIMAEQIRKV